MLFKKLSKKFHRYLIVSREKKRLSKFKRYNLNKNRCFIIGNGPSINQQNLLKITQEVTFVTNWFVLHNDYNKISPNYYCISDPRIFEDNFKSSKLCHKLSEKASNTIKFFPLSSIDGVASSKIVNLKTIFYLDYIAKPIWELQHINLNPLKGVYTGDTVVIDFCLPLAHFMGFKEVFLIGCDCSNGKYTRQKSQDRHFYSENEHASRQQSDEYLENEWQRKIFASYEVSRNAFESSDRKIYNATKGGELEVFERVDFDSLF